MANEPHRFPCLFWDANGGPVNVSLAYKDNTDTWQVNADIVTDALASQFINQHNQLVYMTDGEYGIVLIESDSFNLELWQEGSAGWSADGTFTLTDDDTSRGYEFVDAITFQNGFHALALDSLVGLIFCDIFPDGAGTWVCSVRAGPVLGESLSITNDKNLFTWFVGITDVVLGQFIVNHNYISDVKSNYAGINLTPQIIIDDTGKVWVFGIDSGTDLVVGIFPETMTIMSNTLDQVIEEKIIDLRGPDEELLNYKVSVRYLDNTLHVVSLEKILNLFNYDYKLTYYRRDQNGWSDAMVVDTWSIAQAAVPDVTEQDARNSVQITIDNSGNILLFNVEWDIANSRGNLQVWELPFPLYDEYTTGGNWSQTINIDGGTDDILGCSSLNIHP